MPDLGAKKITLNYGYSSGPIALSYASAQSNIKTIYILGFDYSGINKMFNNVYANTAHYKKSSETETYYGNWVDQTLTVIRQHPKIQYYRIISDTGVIPDKLKTLSNLEHWDLTKFQTIINN
jgi:isocitrate lyase